MGVEISPKILDFLLFLLLLVVVVGWGGGKGGDGSTLYRVGSEYPSLGERERRGGEGGCRIGFVCFVLFGEGLLLFFGFGGFGGFKKMNKKNFE